MNPIDRYYVAAFILIALALGAAWGFGANAPLFPAGKEPVSLTTNSPSFGTNQTDSVGLMPPVFTNKVSRAVVPPQPIAPRLLPNFTNHPGFSNRAISVIVSTNNLKTWQTQSAGVPWSTNLSNKTFSGTFPYGILTDGKPLSGTLDVTSRVPSRYRLKGGPKL